MKTFELGKYHSITVEKANRGIDNDYKITFFENGRILIVEYGNAEYIEFEYGVKM